MSSIEVNNNQFVSEIYDEFISKAKSKEQQLQTQYNNQRAQTVSQSLGVSKKLDSSSSSSTSSTSTVKRPADNSLDGEEVNKWLIAHQGDERIAVRALIDEIQHISQ